MTTAALALSAYAVIVTGLLLGNHRGRRAATPTPEAYRINVQRELPPVPLTATERAWLCDQPVECLSDSEILWRFQDAIRFEKWSVQ